MSQSWQDADTLGRSEACEAEAWGALYPPGSAEAASACGLELYTIGGARVCIASRVDVLAFNRVIGLGLAEPATEQMLDEIVGRYRSSGCSRFFVQLAPTAVPDSLVPWLRARGFRRYNNWVKLGRGVEPSAEVHTDLRVEPCGTGDASTFAALVAECLGWPGSVEPCVASTVGRPGWRHYLAWSGDTPVATAAMYARDGVGWIDFASTHPDHRGLGAQGALTARRISDARELGCRRLVVETAEQTPDHPAPSYRNMLRLGFRVAYLRPNYLLELTDG